jgi:thiol-disulfide isomerase/thioredoxin
VLLIWSGWRAAGAASSQLLDAVSAPLAPALLALDSARWLNGPPLDLAQLRGKVDLLDFWTFDCRNCHRALPWLNALENRLREAGLRVVGVPTPGFERG